MQEIGVDGFHGINIYLGIEFDPLFAPIIVHVPDQIIERLRGTQLQIVQAGSGA